MILFLVLQFTSLKLSIKSFTRILKGLLYTFIGLVLFLAGVNALYTQQISRSERLLTPTGL
ncbi:MAG: DUF1538 family protein [Bacillota bacterium]|nr:DUF1538 family protein [Bacillota bacterium]MDD3298862.1 DUF1538 family protein [Bacillota bacterium]MDD3851552.1 DUF1538 family protein [Bacillota bacterium]